MFDVLFFGIGAGLMLGMWLFSRRTRRRLTASGTAVRARVTGTVESRDGSAYVLEFQANGSTHRLNYPRPRKGEPLKPGSEVTLYYDPYKPEKMFVDGDKTALMTEKFYLGVGIALLLLLAVRMAQ